MRSRPASRTCSTRRRPLTSPTTAIARMKEAGVTTIIISTDPLIPANITKEATAQNYFPEWVIGPSVLADTTIFGRTFDQEQWAHALGPRAHHRPGRAGAHRLVPRRTSGTTANRPR